MDLSLIYRALADGQVDVIAGDATSALIDALDLARLEDTPAYFPPYDAVPVVRTARCCGSRQSAARWRGSPAAISERDMRAMNRAVDVDKKDPREVAGGFLKTR